MENVRARRSACEMGRPCREHDCVHGAEAEELRAEIEKYLAEELPTELDVRGVERSLQRILDRVNARDSLAYLEATNADGANGETTEDWEARALRSARNNHIWLNAFSCVRPTEEFCAALGRQILDMLNETGNTIPSEHRLVGTERCLVLRINKS